jgi:hypothetical protein
MAKGVAKAYGSENISMKSIGANNENEMNNGESVNEIWQR